MRHSSTEAAIALRQRLNETVDQLDALRKDHAELEVQFETINKELTIAKSDCTRLSLHLMSIDCAGSDTFMHRSEPRQQRSIGHTCNAAGVCQ